MGAAQEQGWHALLDLYETHREGWTLIGGQMVHLYCAERGYEPARPTTDADTVVNAREPGLLRAVTATLLDLGFSAEPSADGSSIGGFVTWPSSTSSSPRAPANGPRREGRRAASPPGRHGPATDAAQRHDSKAAARIETNGAARERHCLDFAALAAMMAAHDTAAFALQPKDKKRLRAMITLTRASAQAMEQNPAAARRLDRLEGFL